MKLALLADIQVDPKRLLASRWTHDTAHAFCAAKRRALEGSRRAKRRRK